MPLVDRTAFAQSLRGSVPLTAAAAPSAHITRGKAAVLLVAARRAHGMSSA